MTSRFGETKFLVNKVRLRLGRGVRGMIVVTPFGEEIVNNNSLAG